MYINHITLATGHNARTSSADVAASTLAVMRPWLAEALAYKDAYPLPGPLGRDGYRAPVCIVQGALLCTVFGPPLVPLVTFGVAGRSRQSAELWAMLVAQYGAKPGLQAPGTPWCAVALHPGYMSQMGVSAWIGDFERCLA